MKISSSNGFWQTIGLSAVAGMRTMLAPAFLSNAFSKKPFDDLKSSSFNAVQRPGIAKALKILALGEFVGDKLPKVGDRIAPGGLIGRSLSGALVGAAIYKSERENAVAGAAVGAAVAVAATFASFYARKKIGEKTGIKNPVLGAIEDALAITIGLGVMKYAQRK